MEHTDPVSPLKTGKSTQVAIRIEDDLFGRLDALVTKLSPPGMALPRSEVIRAALTKGLEALEGGAPVAAQAAPRAASPFTIALRPRQVAEVEVLHAYRALAYRDTTSLEQWFRDSFAVDFAFWLEEQADREAAEPRRAGDSIVPAETLYEWRKRLHAARVADPWPEVDDPNHEGRKPAEPTPPKPAKTTKKK